MVVQFGVSSRVADNKSALVLGPAFPQEVSFLVGLREDGWSMDEILGLLGQPPAAFCLPQPDQ